MPPCSSYTVSLGACYMFRVCICTPGFIRKYRKWCDFIYCIISSIWAGMSVSWTCRAARIDGWRFQNAAVVYKEQFRKQLAATSGLVSKVTENEKTAVISILSSLNQNKESVMQHSEDVFFFKWFIFNFFSQLIALWGNPSISFSSILYFMPNAALLIYPGLALTEGVPGLVTSLWLCYFL